LGIGQHRQKSRTRFPADFALLIEIAHRMSASFVLPQDLRQQLTFGEINVIHFYLVVGDIDPASASAFAASLFFLDAGATNLD
jgi:hypothetical protein